MLISVKFAFTYLSIKTATPSRGKFRAGVRQDDVIWKRLWKYRKNPKISDTRKFAVITLKVEQDGFSLE